MLAFSNTHLDTQAAEPGLVMLAVTGMTCASCASAIQGQLIRQHGVLTAEVSLPLTHLSLLVAREVLNAGCCSAICSVALVLVYLLRAYQPVDKDGESGLLMHAAEVMHTIQDDTEHRDGVMIAGTPGYLSLSSTVSQSVCASLSGPGR